MYNPGGGGGGSSHDAVNPQGTPEVTDPDSPYSYPRAKSGRIVNGGIEPHDWQTTRTLQAPYIIGVTRFDGFDY